MNDLAIKLIEREISKKEKQLAEVLTLLADKPADEYESLIQETKEKLQLKRSGKLPECEFMAFLSEAAKKEKDCMRRLDPKLSQRLYDKQHKLQTDIDSLAHSLWRLS